MSGSGDLSNGSEWELSKENIQPLKQGRKVANLSAAFGESSNDYQSRLHREIQTFETAIRTYDGDDPLEVWYRYFVWLCENFPTGGKDQHVLLERCITVFKDEGKYKNDERYLKIWLRYADITADPVVVYEYMYSQGICDKLANFYEYWAYVFERLGNMKKADELYTLGKNRNAEPLERLQHLHRAFEIRLAENVNNIADESANENEKQRTALGGLKGHGKKGTVGVKRTGNATLATRVGGIGQPLLSNNARNPGFTVFSEEAEMNGIGPSTGDWQAPPTRPTVTKENTQKPGKWTEAKMSQRHQRSSIPVNDVGMKPSFTVHEDDEGVGNPPCTPQHHNPLDQVLSSRKPGKDTTNELLKSISKSNKDDEKFKVMYCKDKIYAGAREFSFEQLRAARMMAKLVGQPWSSLYPESKNAGVQFKVMYPKNEVYPFDSGERPYEEILLKRYFERKEKRRKLAETVALASTCPDSPMEVNPPANVSQMMEQMEIGSCHKTVLTTQHTASFQVYDDTDEKCDNLPARRGLTFQTQQHEEPSNHNMIYQDPEPEPTPVTTNQSFSTTGTTSAFNVVPKGLSRRPFAEQAVPLEEAKAEERERLPSNVPEMHQGLQPLPGSLNSSYLSHISNRVGVNSSGNQTPGGGDNYMASPTVTMNTRAAQDVVMAMFNNPLGMDHEDDLPWVRPQEIPTTARDFEAAFKDDNKTGNVPLATNNNPGFTIFDETAAGTNRPLAQPVMDEENQENRPPRDFVQEKNNRPIMGILQPSHGIPVCPLEDDQVDDYDEGENVPPRGFHSNKSDVYSKTMCEVTEDANNFLASSSFKAAARMASTPHSQGMEPPSFVLSTIKPPKTDTDAASAHDPTDYGANTFACTPNKVLSPIFERSDEDVRSTASSSSSTASSGRGSVSQHISAGMKLESIVEDPRSFSEEQKSDFRVCHDGQQPFSELALRSEDHRTIAEAQKSDYQVHPEDHRSFQEAQSSDYRARSEDPRTFTEERAEYQTCSEVSRQGFGRDEEGCRVDGTTELNPFSDEVTNQLLRIIEPPVSSYQGFFSCYENLPNIAEKLAIDLGEDDLYQVRHRIGSGAFAKVYCAYKLSSDLKADDSDRTEVILKVQKTPNEWEFYMCRQLHARIDTMQCGAQMHTMFMNPSRIYNYANGSVLVDQYSPLGTMLDVSNMYKRTSPCSEEIVTSVAVSLLCMIVTMQRCGIIHGDIKPDNILLFESISYKDINLKLIDFGRGIDMSLFPAGTMFSANCYTEGFQCIEMKTGQPWTLQVDTYGLLGVLYCLIHGDYMKVYQKNGSRWIQNRSFKRHWNVELWTKLFDLLLNTPSPSETANHCEVLLQEFIDYSSQILSPKQGLQELERHMKTSTKYDEELRRK